MLIDGRELRPSPGWVLVREHDMGETAGGIVIPSPSNGSAGKHHLVLETSAGYFEAGKLVECSFRAGDYVVLRPMMPVGAGGAMYGCPRASMPHFPPGVFLIQMGDVIGYERPADMKH